MWRIAKRFTNHQVYAKIIEKIELPREKNMRNVIIVK